MRASRSQGSMTPLRLLWLVAVALCACRNACPTAPARALHRPPTSFGPRVLVVAPHPDDETIAAEGLIAATVRDGGDVHVVVVTDGEAGVNRTRVANLGAARETETRAALATVGVQDDAVDFLRWADGGLARAWSERWLAARSGGPAAASLTLVDDLRAAIRRERPDTVVVPLPRDEHPDHTAIGKFALLALLGETSGSRSRVLGYVVHGPAHWPACGTLRSAVPRIPPGCAGLSTWTGVPLGPSALAAKENVLRDYRTQLGPTLLRYTTPTEAFATDLVVVADRAASPARPAVHRTVGGVAIIVPRDRCLVDVAGGDRLRLRYFRAGVVEERVVDVHGGTPIVRGGVMGDTLDPVHDVVATIRPHAVDLALDGASFEGIAGAVLEIVRPPGGGAAWLVRWASRGDARWRASDIGGMSERTHSSRGELTAGNRCNSGAARPLAAVPVV